MIDWSNSVGKFIIWDKQNIAIHYIMSISKDKLSVTIQTVRNDAVPYLKNRIFEAMPVNSFLDEWRIMTNLEKIKYL